MGWLVRAAPTALLHVNLLLMLYAGASLLTAARLKWDPTAYVAARELFPREYRAASAALPAFAVALLLLAQLALTALRCRRAPRRSLLILYATAMLVILWGEVALGAWAAWRCGRWARGPRALELRRALALRHHLRPLLEQLASYHPLPDKIQRLMREAEGDLPRLGRVAGAAAATLAALQLLAAALALTATIRTRDAASADATLGRNKLKREDVESAPLRAAYKNGRLVAL